MNDTRDREMVMSPGKWPAWPRLPLVRRNSSGQATDCGYLVDGTGLQVHIGNIYMPPAGEAVPYPDIDTLLAEWRVD